MPTRLGAETRLPRDQAADDLTIQARKDSADHGGPSDAPTIVTRFARQITETTELEVRARLPSDPFLPG